MPRLRLLGEPADGSARAVIGAGEIRGHEVVEPIVGTILVRAADTAAGDAPVDRAVRLHGSSERVLHLSSIADVAAAGVGAESPGDELEPLELAREQRERGALRRQALRDRLADPHPAAGDDDMPAAEALHSAPFLACSPLFAGFWANTSCSPAERSIDFGSRCPSPPTDRSSFRARASVGNFDLREKKISQFAGSEPDRPLTFTAPSPSFLLAASTERD